MTIADAARATRTYATALNESGMFSVVPWIDAGAEQTMFKHSNEDVALAVCDRLNLLAVLEAIREPTEGMLDACMDALDLPREPSVGYRYRDGPRAWRAMIAELIAEVRYAGNDA